MKKLFLSACVALVLFVACNDQKSEEKAEQATDQTTPSTDTTATSNPADTTSVPEVK
ncbi:MAG: hypothetical protein ORN85_00675 [Sediminibacterium sp.]|nr:hypothetical protein [Sediminibacterium sp.]